MKTAIVTGGSRGIGARVSQLLAAQGWRVVVASRSAPAKLETNIEHRPLDISSFASIRAFAAGWNEPVHALVNNAGNMFPPGSSVQRSADGVELTMATNYYGAALLTGLMLDKLRASAPARVVNVSSRSIFGFTGMNGPAHWDWDNLEAQKDYVSVEAYKRSKLALTWFTMELARRQPDKAVAVNAVCPGFVPETVAENATGVTRFMFKHVMTKLPMSTSLEAAAANVAWTVTDPLPGDVSGQLFGERKPVDLKAPAAYDPATMKRLFELTAKVTGHTF